MHNYRLLKICQHCRKQEPYSVDDADDEILLEYDIWFCSQECWDLHDQREDEWHQYQQGISLVRH
jgi:hypothetical protein